MEVPPSTVSSSAVLQCAWAGEVEGLPAQLALLAQDRHVRKV